METNHPLSCAKDRKKDKGLTADGSVGTESRPGTTGPTSYKASCGGRTIYATGSIERCLWRKSHL